MRILFVFRATAPSREKAAKMEVCFTHPRAGKHSEAIEPDVKYADTTIYPPQKALLSIIGVLGWQGVLLVFSGVIFLFFHFLRDPKERKIGSILPNLRFLYPSTSLHHTCAPPQKHSDSSCRWQSVSPWLERSRSKN